MCFHWSASDGATVGADAPVLPHFLQVDNWCGTKPLSHFLCPSIPQALMNTSPGSRWRTIGGTCGLPSFGRKTSTAAFLARPRGKTAAASAQVQHSQHHPEPAGVYHSNGSLTLLTSWREVDLFLRISSSAGRTALVANTTAGQLETFIIRVLRIHSLRHAVVADTCSSRLGPPPPEPSPRAEITGGARSSSAVAVMAGSFRTVMMHAVIT